MAAERTRGAGDLLRLALIGTAAGAFSGLFGVGGGTVIVPLLILWFGYGERLATGTSLMAIIVIAVLAVAGHGFYGNVEIEEGLLLSIPAVLGVVLGTAAQQRLPERLISGVFALLLVAVAVELVIP
ncbi:MAG TPA: sulfite exporter TauE/SafE family protein [Solirubrobacterales bacterium]|nr:sulfite exporter TauE/SafE family protein [Solirubrobacterales bacterium]